MLKRRLFTPGPVPVPERVLLAMAQPVINHRAPDFLPVFAACKRGLQRMFQTECPVLILSASGTGAMDASVSNLLSPGDHALVINGGKFGERWTIVTSAPLSHRSTAISCAELFEPITTQRLPSIPARPLCSEE